MAVKLQCRTGGQHSLSDESACGSEQSEQDEGMPENNVLERDEEIPAQAKRSYESRRGEAATAEPPERTMKINKRGLQRRRYFESDEEERDDNFGSALSSDPKRR